MLRLSQGWRLQPDRRRRRMHMAVQVECGGMWMVWGGVGDHGSVSLSCAVLLLPVLRSDSHGHHHPRCIPTLPVCHTCACCCRRSGVMLLMLQRAAASPRPPSVSSALSVVDRRLHRLTAHLAPAYYPPRLVRSHPSSSFHSSSPAQMSKAAEEGTEPPKHVEDTIFGKVTAATAPALSTAALLARHLTRLSCAVWWCGRSRVMRSLPRSCSRTSRR